mmetsp:Transcript_72645/g.196454  ORF Transcript_72645/g.196454 Transcript_72645/m.196454 type:complete len:418 (-) Transcript_72645:34-1287(-)
MCPHGPHLRTGPDLGRTLQPRGHLLPGRPAETGGRVVHRGALLRRAARGRGRRLALLQRPLPGLGRAQPCARARVGERLRLRGALHLHALLRSSQRGCQRGQRRPAILRRRHRPRGHRGHLRRWRHLRGMLEPRLGDRYRSWGLALRLVHSLHAGRACRSRGGHLPLRRAAARGAGGRGGRGRGLARARYQGEVSLRACGHVLPRADGRPQRPDGLPRGCAFDCCIPGVHDICPGGPLRSPFQPRCYHGRVRHPEDRRADWSDLRYRSVLWCRGGRADLRRDLRERFRPRCSCRVELDWGGRGGDGVHVSALLRHAERDHVVQAQTLRALWPGDRPLRGRWRLRRRRRLRGLPEPRGVLRRRRRRPGRLGGPGSAVRWLRVSQQRVRRLGVHGDAGRVLLAADGARREQRWGTRGRR